MNIQIVKNAKEGGKVAFDLIKEKVLNNDSLVLGLATGSTPETMYEEMVNSDVDFSHVTSVNLDEYVGLEDDHPQSYHYFMEEKLFSKKPFKETFVPSGTGEEKEVTEEYDRILEEHPVDIQVLGIGGNGHIGFNEPGTSFDSTTHKVALTPETIEANKRFFDTEEEVPRYAYTMGIKSILNAKHIVLMAFGENKADAIKASIEGPVTEEVPASVLQRHLNVTVIVDEAAASKLSK